MIIYETIIFFLFVISVTNKTLKNIGSTNKKEFSRVEFAKLILFFIRLNLLSYSSINVNYYNKEQVIIKILKIYTIKNKNNK